MAKLMETSRMSSVELRPESQSYAESSVADDDLNDLIYSWQRLEHPALRRLAVRLVRSLREDSLVEHFVLLEMT